MTIPNELIDAGLTWGLLMGAFLPIILAGAAYEWWERRKIEKYRRRRYW